MRLRKPPSYRGSAKLYPLNSMGFVSPSFPIPLSYPIHLPVTEWGHPTLLPATVLSTDPRQQQFPPVLTNRLMTSATNAERLIQDAQQILDRIKASQDFAYQLKEAAQKSEQGKVDQLIHGLGLRAQVKTSFTPDRINFELQDRTLDSKCCIIRIALNW
jgi:hypothetical protein